MADPFRRDLLRVVNNDNCSGCGVCAHVSDRVTMSLDPDSGFLRPQINDLAGPPEQMQRESREFNRVCPGRRVDAPNQSTHDDPDFGGYESVWQAQASDPIMRHRGSSAGVLTALSTWMLESNRVTAVSAARTDLQNPTLTAAERYTESSDLLETTGSRYAPVSTAQSAHLGASEAIVGKPCEAAGIRALEQARGDEPSFLMSFFCAGTPSQHATERLIDELNIKIDDVDDLRYRGNGWPGSFSVVSRDGTNNEIPYASAWSRVLGRDIQTRCRTCADGTGRLADVVVADYWEADEKGYPKFSEAEGRSAVIARTKRGHETLLAAASAGVIVIERLDIADLVSVQPAQTKRQHTMLGRLAARLLMMKRIPRYTNIVLWRHALRHPIQTALHLGGTVVRTRKAYQGRLRL